MNHPYEASIVPHQPSPVANAATQWALDIPFFWHGRICIGIAKNMSTDNAKSILLFIKRIGKKPNNIGDTATKKMYGIQIIKQQDRIKIGLLKRCQTIKKLM